MEVTEVYAQQGSFLHFSWGIGNQLHVCGVGTPGHGEAQPVVSTVEWGMPSAAQERVTMELTTAFRDYHRTTTGASSSSSSAAHTRDAYFEKVERVLQASRPSTLQEWQDVEEAEYQLQVDAAVLHLLRTFLVEAPKRDGYIGEALAEWFYAHAATVGGSRGGGYEDPREQARQLRESASPSGQPTYWEAVARLVAVGLLQDAGDLLQAHAAMGAPDALRKSSAASQAEYEIVSGLVLLLGSFPRLHSSNAGAIFVEPGRYERIKSAWNDNTLSASFSRHLRPQLRLCADHNPATTQGVEAVMRVLEGSTVALQGCTANWVELLVAALLHVHPMMRLQPSLADYATTAYTVARPASPDLSDLMLDLIKVATRMEMQQMVALCADSPLLSAWLAAHIFDLLAATPAGHSLQEPLPHLCCTQAEMYRLEYAQCLMMSPTTWLAAAEYLTTCPAYGAATMESLLLRLPVPAEDDRAAHKALHVAHSAGLPHVAGALCRVRAIDRWLAGSIAAALQWALRGRDQQCCAIMARPLAESILQRLTPGGNSYVLQLEGAREVQDLEGLLAGAMEEGDSHSEGGEDGGAVRRHGRSLSAVALLQRCLALYQALYHVQLHQKGSTPVEVPLWEALQSARAATLDLVLCEPPSKALQHTVLAAVAPLMEGPYRVFSSQDVMAMQNALLGSTLLQPAFSRGALQQRAVQDCFLAAARSSAKAFVLRPVH